MSIASVALSMDIINCNVSEVTKYTDLYFANIVTNDYQGIPGILLKLHKSFCSDIYGFSIPRYTWGTIAGMGNTPIAIIDVAVSDASDLGIMTLYSNDSKKSHGIRSKKMNFYFKKPD